MSSHNRCHSATWLFNAWEGPTWTAEQYHLGNMPGMVGEDFDLSYYKKAKRFEDYFSEDEGLWTWTELDQSFIWYVADIQVRAASEGQGCSKLESCPSAIRCDHWWWCWWNKPGRLSSFDVVVENRLTGRLQANCLVTNGLTHECWFVAWASDLLSSFIIDDQLLILQVIV